MEMNDKIAFGGFCLLSTSEFEQNEIFLNLKKDWNIKINADTTGYIEKENSIRFEVDEMECILIFSDNKIDEKEIRQKASFNYNFENAEDISASHSAYLMLAVTSNKTYVQTATLFTKIASACMDLHNSIAIYTPYNIIPADDFVEEAQYIRQDYLPIENWIYIGISQEYSKLDIDEVKSTSLYTIGMKGFGKDEIEILESKEDVNVLRKRLLNIAYYILDTDTVLSDEETLTINEKDENSNIYPVKFKIKYEKAVRGIGKTLQIEKVEE